MATNLPADLLDQLAALAHQVQALQADNQDLREEVNTLQAATVPAATAPPAATAEAAPAIAAATAVKFAETPGLHDMEEIIDYTSKQGTSLFNSAT